MRILELRVDEIVEDGMIEYIRLLGRTVCLVLCVDPETLLGGSHLCTR